MQIHLCINYLDAGITKIVNSDWLNGSTIWRILSIPPYNRISPEMLNHLKFAFAPMGTGAALIELLFPFLIWPKVTRPYFLFLIISLHLGIGAIMKLQQFGFVMIVLNIAAFGPDWLLAPNGWKLWFISQNR